MSSWTEWYSTLRKTHKSFQLELSGKGLVKRLSKENTDQSANLGGIEAVKKETETDKE
jgi:hypothetical protein